MSNIIKELKNMDEYIDSAILSSNQDEKVKKVVESKRRWEISFEEMTKKVIEIRSKELWFKKWNKRDKIILDNFLWLIEHINESRRLDWRYKKELDPISKDIRKQEKKYWLKDWEFFHIDESPKEIKKLNNEYDKVIEQKEKTLLKEFLNERIRKYFSTHINQFYKTRKQHLKELKKLWEKERNKETKNIKFIKKPIDEIILMNRYYNDFKKCYKNWIYFSAIIMLWATFECLLIFIISQNSKTIKLKELYNMRLAGLIELANSLKLMPEIESSKRIFYLKELSQNLRLTRNLIHPWLVIRDNQIDLLQTVEKKDIDFLHNIFQIFKKHNRKRTYN